MNSAIDPNVNANSPVIARSGTTISEPVRKRRDEGAQRHLREPIAQEPAQCARRELAARQLQGNDRDREYDADEAHRRAGDRRRHLTRRFGAAGELEHGRNRVDSAVQTQQQGEPSRRARDHHRRREPQRCAKALRKVVEEAAALHHRFLPESPR
jgi:hypothetical protein